MFGGRRVDLGLHPDALDAPDQYAERLEEQLNWYRTLTGRPALSVRNHGFLNDGYWGHLPSWLRSGIRISSNLPGLDGRVLNGSLLPARLVFNEVLTPHWSVLTAIGDGVRYALGMNENDAGDCVWRTADSIRTSGMPGVMVLNLHPQNVSDTRAMHAAAIEVIRGGFLAWTMQDCLDWFESRDTGASGAKTSERVGILNRAWRNVRARLVR
jgi:hypothetical protein